MSADGTALFYYTEASSPTRRLAKRLPTEESASRQKSYSLWVRKILFKARTQWSRIARICKTLSFWVVCSCSIQQSSCYTEDSCRPAGHSNYQIGVNRTPRGHFLGLHFFWCWYIENWILTQIVLLLMWPAVHTRTSSEWSTKDLGVSVYTTSALSALSAQSASN